MRRHKSLIPLSREHHPALLLAQLLKKDAPPYKGLPGDLKGKAQYAISFWHDELQRHFRDEEQILFPFIRGHHNKIDELCAEILQEHRLLEKLFKQLQTGKPNASLLDKIGTALEKHIRKEERVLFQKIQEKFSEDVLGELTEKMEAKNTKRNTTC